VSLQAKGHETPLQGKRRGGFEKRKKEAEKKRA